MPRPGAHLQRYWLALACAAALSTAGCWGRHKVQAAAPPTATNPAPAPDPSPETKTDIGAKSAPSSSKSETTPAKPASEPPVRTVPDPAANTAKSTRTNANPPAHRQANPSNADAPPAAPTAPAAKPPAPSIVPSFSPEEEAQYRRKTDEAVATAEKNVEVANGKKLNAGQRDLLEKVRGFLAQSYEARRRGELVRALNLAEKAQVLSTELVGML
ncbi:MAG: hypothetical protein HY046_14700 [Acidobacteria bacterium]|nr:hypothetical protein [Acidobacteriota bacterium]